MCEELSDLGAMEKDVSLNDHHRKYGYCCSNLFSERLVVRASRLFLALHCFTGGQYYLHCSSPETILTYQCPRDQAESFEQFPPNPALSAASYACNTDNHTSLLYITEFHFIFLVCFHDNNASLWDVVKSITNNDGVRKGWQVKYNKIPSSLVLITTVKWFSKHTKFWFF